MAFNGSGTFTIDTPGNPVQPDTIARASVHNDTLTEIAAGLSNVICRDGQSVVTQDIPFNSHRITGLAEGVSIHDAATIQSLIGNTGKFVLTVGGSGNAITLTTTSGLSLGNGSEFWFVATNTNTGAVTVNINGLGAKSLTKAGTISLSPSDIMTGMLIGIMYDGTRFQMLPPYYAQGTWTPTVGGSATYTTQSASWTKIGRLVYVHMLLIINTIGTGSANVISGLPFTAYSSVGNQHLGVLDFVSLATSVVWIAGRVNNGQNTVTLINLTAAGSSSTSSALMGDGTSIQLSGTYCTT